MGLLNRLTIKNLKLNKKRTIVTIIGIILATSLITSVATLVSSLYASTIEDIKKSNGNYHYEFFDIPAEKIEEIKSNKNIEDFFVTKNIGFKIAEEKLDVDDEEEYNLYSCLQIVGFSKEAIEKSGLKLIEGRMPKNESEIVISSKDVIEEAEIGREITLTINKNKINEDTEESSKEITKIYKIVGIVEITDNNIEIRHASDNFLNYSTIITYLENYTNEDNLNIYIRCRDLTERNETVAQILEIDENTFNKLKTTNRKSTENNLSRNETNKYRYIINEKLIALEIGDFIDETTMMIFLVALVVIVIIIITSVYCIRNSFQISITEKVKQYGMLSSIGATSKQIKRNVLYEAFILGIIAIPLGIILGISSIYILLKVVEEILSENVIERKFIFSINIIAIEVAIVLGVVTIYFSARKAAKKASKISPIEAIRSNQDIKMNSKKIKAPKFIKKVFGVGGEIAYKNLKRNSQKYRTTLISIIVSVSVFIAMFSFMNYAFKISEIYFNHYNYNVFMYGKDYEKLKILVEDLNLEAYSLLRNENVYSENLIEHVSEETSNTVCYVQNDLYFKNLDYNTISIISIGEQEYNRYIKKLKLEYDKVKEKAILLDYRTKIVQVDGKQVNKIFRMYDYQKGDIIQFEKEEQLFDIEIAAITDIEPMSLDVGNFSEAFLIVSDEYMNKHFKGERVHYGLYINAKNHNQLKEYIKRNYSDSYFIIGDKDVEEKEQKTMWTTISIFLYGFIIIISLIGVTNVFNTITTNMELRQKEFAHLKAIGMTKKEFNRMIRLESLFYGLKSLIIGVPLGIGFSYLVYKAFCTNVVMEYILPTKGIIIAILAVSILMGTIMKYSLNKINKQNIIETIRRDNV